MYGSIKAWKCMYEKMFYFLTGEPIPYDPTFDGPLRNRSCTDVICTGIFLVFIGVWIGLGLYGKLNIITFINSQHYISLGCLNSF